jgi:GNAT superfamily N-acetyltransferase
MINIAAPEPRQASEVARLYHNAWHESQACLQDSRIAAFRDDAFFLRRVERELGSSLAAWRKGCCIGYAAWNGGILERLFVAADERRLGIGKLLLHACEKAMSARGVREASLNCLVGNDGARRFYERHGWTCVGTRMLPARWARGTVEVSTWKLVKILGDH